MGFYHINRFLSRDVWMRFYHSWVPLGLAKKISECRPRFSVTLHSAVVIGLIFGFGVFEHGFDKLKHIFHHCEADARNGTSCVTGRSFLAGAPPPH
ncbi:hypothetical protein Syun_026714 [Stephania yunnanensis]|uniref:Uncharacterized protein n=1 Tax=Stephania yunnanensis TaxID=152371 RepID=A0AAP0EJR7_9MAGN